MAIQQNDPYGSNLSDDEILRRRSAQFDNEIPDPVLDPEPASSGRLALFAIAFIAILGVVFYGLNNPSTTPQTTPTAQTQTSPMRAPGQTTGSAMTPAQPSPPAAQPSPPAAPAAPSVAPATPPANN